MRINSKPKWVFIAIAFVLIAILATATQRPRDSVVFDVVKVEDAPIPGHMTVRFRLRNQSQRVIFYHAHTTNPDIKALTTANGKLDRRPIFLCGFGFGDYMLNPSKAAEGICIMPSESSGMSVKLQYSEGPLKLLPEAITSRLPKRLYAMFQSDWGKRPQRTVETRLMLSDASIEAAVSQRTTSD